MKQFTSNGIILLLLIALGSSCKKPTPPQAPLVIVESVNQNNVKLYGEYVGRIRAFKYVEVRARVEGYLEKMMFEEGRRVSVNDPLFLIDPAQYKARADKAEAQLKKDIASFNSQKLAELTDLMNFLHEEMPAIYEKWENSRATKQLQK